MRKGAFKGKKFKAKIKGISVIDVRDDSLCLNIETEKGINLTTLKQLDIT